MGFGFWAFFLGMQIIDTNRKGSHVLPCRLPYVKTNQIYRDLLAKVFLLNQNLLHLSYTIIVFKYSINVFRCLENKIIFAKK